MGHHLDFDSQPPSDTANEHPVHRWWKWGAVIVACLVLGIVAVERTVSGTSDLRGFHRIWQANLAAPTQPTRQHGEVEQDPDPYPPTSYVIFAPFGMLPLSIVGALWFALNLACSVGVWKMTSAWLGGGTAARRTLVWGAIGVFPFWLGNLLAGQNAPLLIWMTMAAYRLASQKKGILGGGLIAVATCIKVIPAVLLLPFILRRDWRVLGGFSAAMFWLVIVVSSLFFGPRVNLDFQTSWLSYAIRGTEGQPDPTRPDSMRGSTRYNNQSVEAVLARLMMPIPAKSDSLFVNVLDVDAAGWRGTRTAVTGMLGLAVLVWFGIRRKSSSALYGANSGTRSEQIAEEFAGASLLMLWLSPIVWSHYYVWMFVPVSLLAARMSRGDTLSRIGFTVWLVSVPLIGIREARAVGIHLAATLVAGLILFLPDFATVFQGKRTGHSGNENGFAVPKRGDEKSLNTGSSAGREGEIARVRRAG